MNVNIIVHTDNCSLANKKWLNSYNYGFKKLGQSPLPYACMVVTWCLVTMPNHLTKTIIPGQCWTGPASEDFLNTPLVFSNACVLKAGGHCCFSQKQ